MRIVSSAGTTLLEIQSVGRTGDQLVIEGQMMGAWDTKMYIEPQELIKAMRLVSPSLLLYVMLFPFFLVRRFLKGRAS